MCDGRWQILVLFRAPFDMVFRVFILLLRSGQEFGSELAKNDMCVANINIENLCNPLNLANLFRLVICIGWGHSAGLCVAFLRLCFN